MNIMYLLPATVVVLMFALMATIWHFTEGKKLHKKRDFICYFERLRADRLFVAALKRQPLEQLYDHSIYYLDRTTIQNLMKYQHFSYESKFFSKGEPAFNFYAVFTLKNPVETGYLIETLVTTHPGYRWELCASPTQEDEYWKASVADKCNFTLNIKVKGDKLDLIREILRITGIYETVEEYGESVRRQLMREMLDRLHQADPQGVSNRSEMLKLLHLVNKEGRRIVKSTDWHNPTIDQVREYSKKFTKQHSSTA